VPQLAHPTSLGDIDDVEAFVQATLNASGIEFQPDEREDLVAEGICVLYTLWATFEPHREGYAQPGRFSGWAAWALPKKLSNAWHKGRPEHRYVTSKEGKREWRFFKASTSLDGLAGADPSDTTSRAEAGYLDARYWTPIAAVASAPAGRAG
jgi:hypothetical protein